MYKATYKQIRDLIDNTEWDTGVFSKDQQVNGEQIAYFSPASSNWAYRIELVTKNGLVYEVVTVYGGVYGYRWLNIPEVK